MTRALGMCVGTFMVALVVLDAQTPQRGEVIVPSVPVGAAGIVGVVKDHDGSPVRRATVRISGDMRVERLTITGDDGAFAFDGLPSGRFTITAEKAGYPPQSYGANQPFRPGSGVMLQDGQRIRDLELTLAKGGAIAGTVVDQRGDPLPGVPIMAWLIRTALGGLRTLDYPRDQPVTVITDDRGMYRVYGLAPGEYTIGTSWYYSGSPEVRIPSDPEIRAAFQSAGQGGIGVTSTTTPTPQPQPSRFNFAPAFIPGVLDPMSASTVTLAPGEVREGVDLRMQFVPMSEIVGTITSTYTEPIQVRLEIGRRSPIQALNSGSVRGASTGQKFSSGSLSPGAYRVTATSTAVGTRTPLWAFADVLVSPDQPSELSLVLQPALTATGHIQFDAGSLVPPKDLSTVTLYLEAVAPDNTSTTTKIDSAGVVNVTGVIPGRYAVSAGIPNGPPTGPWWSVKSVIVDGSDVTDLPFEIGPASSPNVTVTFTDVTGELSGALTKPTGAPATDYFVILMPADRAYWGRRSRRLVSTRPDRAGHYVFPRLPAGEYLIAVTTDLVRRDLEDPTALERLASDAAKLVLGFGERKTLDLRTVR